MLALRHRIKTFSPPICPACKSNMVFVRASKEEPDFKQRTFKCQQCDRAATDIVKVGPVLWTRDIKR